jgi:hypothetical protein
MAGYEVDREWVREWVRRTRAEQGLPPKVEDPATLAAAAVLILPWFLEQGLISPRSQSGGSEAGWRATARSTSPSSTANVTRRDASRREVDIPSRGCRTSQD